MKKKILIIACAVLSLCLITAAVALISTRGPLSIYNAQGELMVSLDTATVSDPGAWPEECRAYIDIAVTEAAEILSQKKNITPEQAKKQLATGGYRLYTAYRPDLQAALDHAYAPYGEQDLEMGAAITDLQGRLLAAFTSHPDKNYATAQTPPYSAFKPLSVYAPALELGKINFSTTFPDAPVTEVNGKPWPSNSTRGYQNEPVPVSYAVQKSLNTVAVRCMDQVGLTNSFAFLDNFDIDLTGEKARAESLGEADVRGNIALGYLDYGVTPVQMAGYYQIFANGGSYAKPQPVLSLEGPFSIIYTYSYAPRQVLSAQTAAVMVRLLQNVVSPGGTARAAYDPDKLTAGKTGTGEKGNWFVGVTPSYSCAVWHGNQLNQNTAAEIFAAVRAGFPEETAQFPEAEGLTQMVFCAESGKLATANCPYVSSGIFPSDEELPPCDIHN